MFERYDQESNELLHNCVHKIILPCTSEWKRVMQDPLELQTSFAILQETLELECFNDVLSYRV